jgi:hypothetical protein
METAGKDLSLAELMATPASAILTKSNYKPK